MYRELTPTDGRKSFYGKATEITTDDGRKLLKSYSTIVAEIDSNGIFWRTWGGYSATTQRHINAFLRANGINEGGKAWTLSQPIKD